MPPRPTKPKGKKRATIGKKIARKAKRVKGALSEQRFDQTGKTTRVRGHVSARSRRAQAKRDSR